MNLVDHDKGE